MRRRDGKRTNQKKKKEKEIVPLDKIEIVNYKPK